MPDYKEMYFKLFRAHAKVIAILAQAGQEAEEMAIEASDPVVFPTLAEQEKQKRD